MHESSGEVMFEAIERRYSPARTAIDPADLPPVVYHYTDAAGLLGMLSTGRIWATEYRFLNDRTEVEHTRALVKSIILARMKEKKHSSMSGLYSRILDQIGRPDDDMEIYVFSLSAEADSLSQWRGYARDGHGFTVGFDASVLLAKAEAEDLFGFCRVEYDGERQSRGVIAALQDIERECSKLIAAKTIDADDILDSAASSFDAIMWHRAVANKHSSFSSENEWRIFSFCEGDDRQEAKVRARPSGLVPYVEFASDQLCDRPALPILRIGVGPGFSDHTQLRAVQVLCRQYGYTPDIYFANAPYRSG
jgi:hypothetical protein